jgi:hypothetical protein
MLPLQEEIRQPAGQWPVRERDQVAVLQGQEEQHLLTRSSTLPTTEKETPSMYSPHNFLLSRYMISKVSISFSILFVACILEGMQNFSEFLHYK